MIPPLRRTAAHQVTLRDEAGRIKERVETVNGAVKTYRYTYDLAGQLTDVADGVSTVHYAYDDNGNRLSRSVNGAVAEAGAYNYQDQVKTYGGFTYNFGTAGSSAGFLQSKTNGTATTTYKYDVFGNLREVKAGTASAITYLVDGQNRRIGKKVGATLVKRWLYRDQLEPVAEIDVASGAVTTFVYGTHQHVPDYMVVKNGAIVNSYRILSDHLGSVRLVVDVNCAAVGASVYATCVKQRIDYDEFGRVNKTTSTGLSFQPFAFAGGLYDVDTDLVRFGARDYDAFVGRWTARDPILFEAGGTNLYAYVGNNPVGRIDPAGLFYWGDYGQCMESCAQEYIEVAEDCTETALQKGVLGWATGICAADPSGSCKKLAAAGSVGALTGAYLYCHAECTVGDGEFGY